MKIDLNADRRRNQEAEVGYPVSFSGSALSQRGVALVITLVMLSVITFMAVTFLVLSQRERGSVSTTTDQTIAKFADETAQQRALAELIAPMLAVTNSQVYDLIVSTNFINPLGFFVNPADWRTNVNYDHLGGGGGGPLIRDQPLRVLTNLYYNPRPPVFITNRITGSNEFRYYLDLNRNGRYDTNGWIAEIGTNGLPVLNGVNTNYVYAVGDPEWIGVLERPDLPHSSSNHFIARYAYIVIPSGKTLDVNYIYNGAGGSPPGVARGTDNFMRNQGVGTWEINLAAFLVDLNTNIWQTIPYDYVKPVSPAAGNIGTAFDDAQSILRYRYNGAYNLFRANNLFINSAALINNGIDDYSDGPLVFGTGGVDETLAGNQDGVGTRWVGSDNPNHVFTTQEFFDPNKILRPTPPPFVPGFVDHLLWAGTNVSSYDRYTFYRMLAQLGTDSAPERSKMNVNYANIATNVMIGNIVPNMETNFIPWTPIQFFMNAADRMLRTNTAIWAEDRYSFTNSFGVANPFGVTAIPVFTSYVTNTGTNLLTVNVYGYTPSVHRVLQVAANVFDATTNRVDLSAYPYVPHVFRPIFRRDGNDNVFIVNYEEVTNANRVLLSILTSTNQVDLADVNSRRTLPLTNSTAVGPELMVSGIPLVIGAKKGFPNFNKFALQNAITVTRKLHFHRPNISSPVTQTNQIYSLQISNSFGIQAWNSYNTNFSRPLQLIAVGDVTLAITNEAGVIIGRPGGGALSNRFIVSVTTNIPANAWRAFSSSQSALSFLAPFITNSFFLTNSPYVQVAGGGSFNTTSQWDPPNTFRSPHWWLLCRSRVRFALVDTSVSPNRIVDYVNLDSTEDPVNIMERMKGPPPSDVCNRTLDNADIGMLWCTNRYGNGAGAPNSPIDANVTIPTYGVWNQLLISLGVPVVGVDLWNDFNSTVQDKMGSIGQFQQRMFGSEPVLDFDAPYNPTRTFYQYQKWEANDPLVHYTIPDLLDLLAASQQSSGSDEFDYTTKGDKSPIKRLAAVNLLSDHYRPWGGNPNNPSETSPATQFETGVKDSFIMRPDDWDFPTNRLPNVGWLGRVHRGSPWQTIYLKSKELPPETWRKWSGVKTNFANVNDSFRSRPATDRNLFDMFTTAINENATRGQLSVNQTNLAAWSAVLSGVVVATNGGWSVIQPAAISPVVSEIVTGINATRANTNRGFTFPEHQFAHVGDVLATPQLTDLSPFFSTNNLPNDEIMERIPQQIMSLLTVNYSPRFVIYSYAQALHPADNSVIRSGGPFFGMCTNYQPTAEHAIRAVVRVDGFNSTNNTPQIVVEQFNVLPPD
jgi:hypothetical protein